ncbi:MAG: hypothetical protein GY847_41670 [Proteobacteria bacterium]|nr:hypothetical protein [Pseudomonadota bacterium]
MKRFTLALVFAVVAICGVTTSISVSAQEILLEGPLAGAPAVRKMVQYRKMRFSVGPQFAYTILNPYMHNFLVGGRLEFNFLDWLGVGAVGYYAFNTPTKLTNHVSGSENLGGQSTTPAQTGSNWPSYTGSDNFEDQVAKLKAQVLGQLTFIPLRGKVSMFEKLFAAIDGAIFVGGGVVVYDERDSCNGSKLPNGDFAGECGTFNGFIRDNDLNRLEPTLKTQVGGTFSWGVNFMAYFNNFVALNIEYRMTPFRWNEGGTDESGQAASTWKYKNSAGDPAWSTKSTGSGDYPDGKIDDEDRVWNLNQSVAIGVIFYLPLTPKVSD